MARVRDSGHEIGIRRVGALHSAGLQYMTLRKIPRGIGVLETHLEFAFIRVWWTEIPETGDRAPSGGRGVRRQFVRAPVRGVFT